MNSFLLENEKGCSCENEKEEQNNCIREGKMESTTQMQLKSSRSLEELELCVEIEKGLNQIKSITPLFYQIKERNSLVQLFYHIRAQNLVDDTLSGNVLKFMAWALKVTKNVNREFTELFEIEDILLKQAGHFLLKYSEFDREYVCEQLIKLEELVKNLEEENCKIRTSLDSEIFNRLSSDENSIQILDGMYYRIAEDIPEIKEINQEDIEEYIEDGKKLYNQFFVL